jgi:hypothetical protein
VGPGVWIKTWDSLANDYARLMVRVVIGVCGIERNFYAVFDANATSNGLVGLNGVIPKKSVVISSHRDYVPVFVEIVKEANDKKIAVSPSVVRFYSLQEPYPWGPDTGYLSLFDRTIKTGFACADGKIGLAQIMPTEPVPFPDSVGNVVKRATHIMNGIPYRAYEDVGNGGSDELRFLSDCRLRLMDQKIAIIPQISGKTSFEVFDVLVGPLQFTPGPT